MRPAGFNWESCRDGAWYETVRSKIGQLQQAGATHIWLPPPSQSVSDQVSKFTSSHTACSTYDAVQVHGFNRLLPGKVLLVSFCPQLGCAQRQSIDVPSCYKGSIKRGQPLQLLAQSVPLRPAGACCRTASGLLQGYLPYGSKHYRRLHAQQGDLPYGFSQ